MFAKTSVQIVHFLRMYRPFREQVRSYGLRAEGLKATLFGLFKICVMSAKRINESQALGIKSIPARAIHHADRFCLTLACHFDRNGVGLEPAPARHFF